MANKYKAKSKEIDGHTFPSLKEANYYLQYKAMLEDGEITDLQLQPQYELLPSFRDNQGRLERAITYKPDFLLTYPDGRLVAVRSRDSRRGTTFFGASYSSTGIA